MITKIKADRHFLFDPAAQYLMSVLISGEPTVIDLRKAIFAAVRKHDILNCRIMMDSDGEAYYVPREDYFIPDIEVCNSRMDAQELIDRQAKKIFDLARGEFVRFIIAKEGDETELTVVLHHIAGDGKSLLFLIQDIMNELECPQPYIEKKDRCVKVLDEKYASQFVQMNDLVKEALDETNKKWRNENKTFDFKDYEEEFESFWSERNIVANSFELNKEQLKAALHLCKEHGVTLNNFIITLVNKYLNQTLKMGVVADTREKDDMLMGNHAEMILMEEQYDFKKDFWENVQYIDRLIKQNIKDRNQLLLSGLIRSTIDSGLHDAANMHSYKSKMVEDYKESFYVGKNGLPIMQSNIGVAPIKYDYGEYQIEKIRFVSPLCTDAFCNIAIVTINNTFVFNMITFEGDARFEGLFDKVKNEILNQIENSYAMQENEYIAV